MNLNLNYIGRLKIFTDVKEVNRNNVVSVLKKAYGKHRMNACDMQYLIDYEAGIQPLPYIKEVRPEIDIKTCDNMANYVTEFWKGYFWGTPPIYTQRGNKSHDNTDEAVDSSGISALNEMMLNGLSIGRERQTLADFVEKTGIGHVIVIPKKDWENDLTKGAYAEVYTLDSRYAFCVYNSDATHKKLMGVTYTKISGKVRFTVFTRTMRYEIQGDEIIEELPNLLGMIPIVEYERSVDRTGRFERQISLMDNLNSMISNFANDVAQKTQELWWGNDIKFPEDENGKPIKPKSGQWLLTFTGGEGNNPKIQPLSSSFDSSPTLDAISNTRNEILQKCYVPMQYSSEGGGSTGIASSLSSGWDAASIAADGQEQLIRGSDRELLALIIKAISLSPKKELPDDDPLRQIVSPDIDIKYTRRQNWDLATKANAFATLVSHGVNGRHALKVANMFEDVEQVYIDSKEGIDEYQKKTYGDTGTSENDRIMQDSSDQSANSPSIDGPSTNTAQRLT